jgi:carbamoyltransferase
MFHAGSSAALVVDGRPVVAVAEERLNRLKYYANFPALSIQECLRFAGMTFADIDHVAVGRDSSANLAKKVEYVIKNPTKLLNLRKIKASRKAMDDLKASIAEECDVDPGKLRFEQHNIEHHLAHTASAYFISPWEKAAGFTMDGSGDFVTCMLSECEGTHITVKKRIYVPHSLGSLYTMICEFIGYGKYGDEGKVMGLAPYGTDNYSGHFEDMVHLNGVGFQLNPVYFMPFGSNQGLTIDETGQMVVHRHYSDKMVKLFGPPRMEYSEIVQRDMDLAHSMQKSFERIYMHVLNALHRIVPDERVVMAGGCVFNSVANGRIFDQTPFRKTCIQPAAGDEGLALGAALYVSNRLLGEPRHVLTDAYLGTEYSAEVIKAELDRLGVKCRRLERGPLIEETAEALVQGDVIGWFQGRMEWGPRALGNRSILAHPGLPDMKGTLNARIKHREWYRPFAPSVLAERQSEIFDHTHPSPFMLHVYGIRPEWRERLVAVNHVDNTGRLQTVAREENPLYYDLIKAFDRKTGIPVVLNTSFNENEPIVCTPANAIECFLRTKMDMLVIGPFICRKK